MRRWLARLSMSFFIIAVVIAWEAHKLPPSPKVTFFYCAAALAAGLGFAGVRERHRPD